MPQTFELETVTAGTVRGTIDQSSRPGRRPTVLICHGFKGFQEWGFLPYLAELLTDRGFTVVRFNFPGNGMLPGDGLVTDPERFRTARPSVDLEALLSLIDRLPELDPTSIDIDCLGLVGHSRGGGMAVLASAHEACRDRLRALVTWSAVADFDRLSDEEKTEWRRTGELTIVNARTGQQLPLGLEILDDLEAHADLLDIEAAATRRDVPWLIVHGQTDETVPLEEARSLFESARQPCQLLEIPAAGHTYEVGHPFRRPSPQLIDAFNATQRWLRTHLASG